MNSIKINNSLIDNYFDLTKILDYYLNKDITSKYNNLEDFLD